MSILYQSLKKIQNDETPGGAKAPLRLVPLVAGEDAVSSADVPSGTPLLKARLVASAAGICLLVAGGFYFDVPQGSVEENLSVTQSFETDPPLAIQTVLQPVVNVESAAPPQSEPKLVTQMDSSQKLSPARIVQTQAETNLKSQTIASVDKQITAAAPSRNDLPLVVAEVEPEADEPQLVTRSLVEQVPSQKSLVRLERQFYRSEEAGNHTQAAVVLSEIKDLLPEGSTHIAKLSAFLNMGKGDWAAAIEALEILVGENPSDQESRQNLALAYYNAQNFERAEKLFKAQLNTSAYREQADVMLKKLALAAKSRAG
jgi:hypothetical protein